MSTVQPKQPEIDTDKVDIPKDFNSRVDFDRAELEELAATIGRVGVITPINVRPGTEGRVELVAGERRLRAAKLAGLKTIPYTFGSGNRRDEAFFENHSRADLNPIETARDIEALAQEHNLTTHAEIAAFLHPKKPRKRLKWVSEHRRLLALPEEVQRYIAAGEVPVAAEPRLRKIADVSPEVAELICKVAKAQEVSRSSFVEQFGYLLEQAAVVADKRKVTMIAVTGFRLSEVIGNEAKRRSFVDRINPLLYDHQRSEDPVIQFTDAEVDAARAAGCLVEYQPDKGTYRKTYAFVTDRVVAADLTERLVDGAEKRAAAAAKAEEEAKAAAKGDKKKAREKQKELGEESQQAKAHKRKAIARKFNQGLKRAMLKKRTASRRKKFALARSKAVAVQLLSDNPDLVAAGLRLVSDRYQEVENKPLKNGGTKQIVSYAPKDECAADVLRRVMEMKDPLEVDELLAEALLAGVLADGEECPSKDRVRWHTPVGREIEKLLATEIKEVRPRRERKPY